MQQRRAEKERKKIWWASPAGIAEKERIKKWWRSADGIAEITHLEEGVRLVTSTYSSWWMRLRK